MNRIVYILLGFVVLFSVFSLFSVASEMFLTGANQGMVGPVAGVSDDEGDEEVDIDFYYIPGMVGGGDVDVDIDKKKLKKIKKKLKKAESKLKGKEKSSSSDKVDSAKKRVEDSKTNFEKRFQKKAEASKTSSSSSFSKRFESRASRTRSSVSRSSFRGK